MARNQKKAALPTASLVFVGLTCLFVAGAGCGYLWHKSQIHTLGQQIRQYETRLDEAKRRRLMLELTYAEMCSSTNLLERVKNMKLDLSRPSPEQIVRLPEAPAAASDEKLVASGTMEGRN